MNRGELLAQIVDPVIVELLFVEAVGAQADWSTGTLEALYDTTVGGCMPAGIRARIEFVAERSGRSRDRG